MIWIYNTSGICLVTQNSKQDSVGKKEKNNNNDKKNLLMTRKIDNSNKRKE